MASWSKLAGSPFELITPYDEAALDNLQWVQSADVIYICDGTQPIQKLSRFALDNWTIAALQLDAGPFRIQNLDEEKTIQCSSVVTGQIAAWGLQMQVLTVGGKRAEAWYAGSMSSRGLTELS